MSRKLPTKNAPKVDTQTPAPKPGWVTEIRKYKVITPLFGGGEEPQKPDSLTTIRATEVRGHLRFWWRATRGGLPEFENKLEKMKEREEKIWGSPAEKNKPGPSKVHVRVLSAQRGEASSNEVGEPDHPWSYVAFPLRSYKDKETGEQIPGGVVQKEGVVFELEIKYKDIDNIKDDVEAALWAWETFGGIGGRTRRGFGALQCTATKLPADDDWTKNNPPERVQINDEYLRKHLLAEGEWPAGVPHLKKASRIKLLRATGNSMEVWKRLFDALKSFRKVIPKFSRAVFGLPILFLDEGTLQGKKLNEKKSLDRLASPVLLKPIACEDGAVGLVAILDWKTVEASEPYTPPGGLYLDEKGQVFSALSEEKAKDIEILKTANKGKPQTDVLQAFFNSLA